MTRSPEHVRGAAARTTLRFIEAGHDVVMKETPDGLFIGNPHSPIGGMVLRPAADMPATHIDVYKIAAVLKLTPIFAHVGRYLPQEIL